jgi:hypothetical protein
MDLYPWLVVSHVSFVIAAFGAHGVSAFAMFRVKREQDRVRAAAVLDLSQTALVAAGIGLVVAVVLGIAAAAMGGHFGRLWPWAALIVVAIAWIAMTPMAANPMAAVRKALGMPSRADKKGDPPPTPATDAELVAAQARLRPELVAGTGLLAIFILVWLMEVKPF